MGAWNQHNCGLTPEEQKAIAAERNSEHVIRDGQKVRDCVPGGSAGSRPTSSGNRRNANDVIHTSAQPERFL